VYRADLSRLGGARWGRDRGGAGSVEPLGQALELFRPQMAVAVQGDHGGLVAELGLDGLDAAALGDRQAGRGVPQVVGAQRAREAGPPGGGLEVAVEELPLAQRPARGAVKTSASGSCGWSARCAANCSQRNRGSRTVRRSAVLVAPHSRMLRPERSV